VHCAGGFYGDQSDQETPNVQNASLEYGDGTLVELEVTTLPSPNFGDIQMGEYFYTPNGYVESNYTPSGFVAGYVAPANRWRTVIGEFTPRNTPDPPSGVSQRASNLSFPRIAYNPGPAIPGIGDKEVSHFQNFIDCVRSRKREDLHCEMLEGHMSTALCHMINIAFRTRRKLTFDPVTETFPGDAEANGYLTRKYREPYVLPEKV
jgi:hypothetical protein